MFDYMIVGAGFAGSVLAERLATQLDKKVLLVEKRGHIGGNAYDHYDDSGILVHRYGPHIFHTNSADIFAYLSRFTEWRPYEHRVLASVDGQLVPMPINLDTVNKLYGTNMTALELPKFFAEAAERTSVGAGTVATAGEAFERIDEAVGGLVERVRGIAAAGRAVAEETDAVRTAMDEAARLTETSSANTQEVSATTEQTAEAARAMAGSAVRLGEAATALEDLVAQFTVSAT